MRENFEKCLREVLKHEGGYANHPSDPGGETMYGITHAVARENGYHGPMRQIPMDVVRRIYRAKYWNMVNGDTLASGVDLAAFDFAVNSGVTRAKEYLARACGGSDAETVRRLCDARMAFLQRLKTWPTFGKGWSRRVSAVRAVSLSMVGQSPSAPKPKPSKTPEVTGAVVAGGTATAGAVAGGLDPWIIGAIVLVAVAAAVFIIMKKKD